MASHVLLLLVKDQLSREGQVVCKWNRWQGLGCRHILFTSAIGRSGRNVGDVLIADAPSLPFAKDHALPDIAFCELLVYDWYARERGQLSRTSDLLTR
jgi:hypothetical protein